MNSIVTPTTILNLFKIAVTVLGCFSIIVQILLLILPFTISANKRLELSADAMGITGKSVNPKKHAICNVECYKSLKSYISSLTSRSARNTIKKVPKALKEHEVTVTTIEPMAMSYAHWRVVYEHEKNAYKFCIKSFFAGTFRYAIAKSMTGSVDCYYIPNETGGKNLIAWSQIIIKGDTLRNMWFYQGSYARSKKLYIWFDAVRASIQRASLQNQIKWIDLGPSITAKAEESKIKFGFMNIVDWNDRCDYHIEGYTKPLSYIELQMDVTEIVGNNDQKQRVGRRKKGSKLWEKLPEQIIKAKEA